MITIKTFIPLLLISLALIFCLSTVSAAPGDNIYVNGSSGNDSWDGQSAVYNNTTGSGPKSTILNATGTVSTNGTIYIADGTYNEHGITINQNMTIIGENQINTIIKAQGEDRIFTINPGVNVTIENLTLSNYGFVGDGAAIRNDGTLNLINCTLAHNYVYNDPYNIRSGFGGAIFNTGILTITDCAFTDNGGVSDGGAIINNGGFITVTNCTFSSNYENLGFEGMSYPAGGAIANDFGTLNISNSTFTDNHAGLGGAIYNAGKFGYATANITNCTFTNNGANYYFYGDMYFGGSGGAIYNYGSYGDATANITNCTFTDNGAFYGGGIFNDGGGGTSYVNINHSTFTGNTALYDFMDGIGGNGGAILNYGDYGGYDTIVHINDSTFTNNIANYGGAIVNEGFKTLANLNITHSTFSGNQAVYYQSKGGFGGAVYNIGFYDNAIVNMTDSTFVGNKAFFAGEVLLNKMVSSNADVYMNFNRIIGNNMDTVRIYNDKGLVDANNNWWGNNTPDFSQLILGMVNPDSWLVMKATANPTSIRVGGTSTITVTISTYNPTTGRYGPVVHCAPIPAIFTATNGDMNPESTYIIPNGSIDQVKSIFTSNHAGTAIINATVDNETVIFSIQANKTLTNITVLNLTGYYGNNATLTAILKDDQGNPVSGETIHFSVNFRYIGDGITDSTGTAIINCPLNFDPNSDPYTIFAILYSNNKYNASMGTGNLTVNINPTTVLVSHVEGYPGDTVSLTATLTDNQHKPLSGEIVHFTVNNQSIGSSITDSTGTATINNYLLNLSPGVYIINATFNGNSNYTTSTGLGTLTVNAIPTNVTVVNVNNYPGQNVTLTANVPDYYGHSINEGFVRFTVNGGYIDTVPVNNGEATLNWTIPSDWSTGTYPNIIFAEYLGTSNFTASNSFGNLTVDPTPTNITVGNFTGINTQTVNLNATLTDVYGHPLTGKTINFKINGVSIGSGTTDNNGMALSYKLSTAGNFTVTAEFAGDSGYVNSTGNGTLTVDPSSDLYIIITSNKNNPKAGEIFTLRYKLGNKGPDDATNVTITIPLPDGFVISEIKGDGTWTVNGNTITWTLKNVTVGDPDLYVSGLLNHIGNFVFSSSISSDTYNINTQGVTPITINAVSEVKAASKTIPMQKTGLPLNGLVLAVMAVFSGLALSKRK